MRTPTLLLLLSSSLPLAAQTPGTWVELSLAPRPFARERHAMVYDVARGESVLFGGHNGAYMGDTWTLGPGGWTQRAPATSPSARADAAMAYDPVHQRAVLLGGTNGTSLNDIWEWDGTTWTQRATGVVGIADAGAAAYDPLQGGVFYNRGSVNLLWNGAVATTLTVAQPIGYSSKMVFHAASNGCLTLAGNTTYVFRQPTGWQQLAYTPTFAAYQQGFAIDPIRNRVFAQGGTGFVGGGSSSGLGFTWQWNGANWMQVGGQQPALLYQHQMVFDYARDTFVLFGGRHNNGSLRDKTYEWQALTQPASYTAYGSGCAGVGTDTPRLQADTLYGSAPILGGTFFALADRLAPNELVVGVLGFSDQSWSGVPLPAPLDAIGMTNCTLWAAADMLQLLGLSGPTGAASWVLPIPGDLGTLGLHFFQQVLTFAPGANPAGLIVSNGAHAVVGL